MAIPHKQTEPIGGQAVIGMLGLGLVIVTVLIFVTQRQLRRIA